MFICLLVCEGLMEIQTPAPILMKFCMHIPTCPRKVLIPAPSHLGLGGLKPYKLKDTFFTKQKVANLLGQRQVPQLVCLYQWQEAKDS